MTLSPMARFVLNLLSINTDTSRSTIFKFLFGGDDGKIQADELQAIEAANRLVGRSSDASRYE